MANLPADPCAVPDTSDPREFYSAKPKLVTRPEDDPPMTVRCESWDRRLDPNVRRVIKVSGSVREPWVVVTGSYSRGLPNDEVRDWPVVPPLTYTVAFRHELIRQKLEQAAHNVGAQVVFGDMDVEAFKG